MKTMALDIGDARIGVALSDALGITAQPYGTIERRSNKAVLKDLVDIALREVVSTIVIGLPLNMDGSLSDQAEKVRKLGDALTKALLRDNKTSSCKVTYWDERLTTEQAKRIVIDSGLKDKQLSSALDRVSAAIILESFMAASSVY